jgi:hypothetical protein
MGLIEFFRYSVMVTEAIAFFVSLIWMYKFGKKNAFIIPTYLAIIVAVETFGWYLALNEYYSHNIMLYRYFGMPIQYIFFFWYYGQIINRKNFNYIFFICFFGYLLSWLLEFYFLPKEFEDKMGISNTIGSLFILVLVFVFFYKLIRAKEILFFYRKQSFWISFGVLTYYLGSFPFYGAGNYLYLHNPNLYMIYIQIVFVLACIMYILFAASFIWGKQK